MNKGKLIKGIIGNAAEEYGFTYTGSSRDGSVTGYHFERKENEVCQTISIVVIGQGIRLMFLTDVFGLRRVEATELIESDFIKGRLKGFLKFSDEEELEKILYHFVQIIEQKGMEIFKEISKPLTEAYPRKEAYWKLYQEHEALNDKYRKLYGLENTEFTTKLMRQISTIILEQKDEKFCDVEEMLIGLAAVYGDQIVRKCGGQWKWNKEFNSCVIYGVHGKACVNPLSSTIFYWNGKQENINQLIVDFKKSPFDTVI